LGQIALIGAIVSFALAGITVLLTVLGVLHYRRVPVDEEIPRVPATTTKFVTPNGSEVNEGVVEPNGEVKVHA